MKLCIIFTLLAVFAVTIPVESQLLCFECEGEECDNLTPEDAKQCPALSPTSPPSTTDGTTTPEETTPHETITDESSTTFIPTTVTEEGSSTTEKETPVRPASSTLESSSTPAESSSTLIPSTTPEETLPTTLSSSTDKGTTEVPSSETTLPESSPPLASSSTPSETPTTEDSTNPAASTTPAQGPTALALSTIPEETTTTTEETPAPENNNDAKMLFKYSSLQRSKRAAGVGYACYRINVPVPGAESTTQQKRGCLAIPEAKSGCEVLKEQFPSSDDCWVCQNNFCNGSKMIGVSFILLLLSVFSKNLL